VTPLPDEQSGERRLITTLAFVASAALAAAALRFAWQKPAIAAAVLASAVAVVIGRFVARRRVRRLLRSGDVDSILERWSGTLDRIPHPSTMAPLMIATAFAAYGWVERARAALANAERGPAWDAAIEHRLFLDALLLTFEGDRDGALERAARLARLPLPPSSPALRGRVSMLRRAVAALARAFAHQSEPGDRMLLERAGNASPLVFWAMRYGAAVLAIDEGDIARVRDLLSKAPDWPTESAFRAFHDEIVERTRDPHAPDSAPTPH
jgi:hypothetical protein